MTPKTLGIIGKTTDWLKNETANVDDLAGDLSIRHPDTKETPTLYKMYLKICEIATNANNLSKIVLDEINKELSE